MEAIILAMGTSSRMVVLTVEVPKGVDAVKISRRMKSGSQIYLRESISVMGQRLTLSNFYSEELQSEYCAIYRTPEEYLNIIRQYFPQANIVETG